MAHNQRHGIAVVGMACRLPGSEDVESYWNGLLEGREGIRPVSDAELTAAGVAPSLVAHPRYRKFAATIAGIDLFDAGSFGFSRAEAAAASPQHRLFLESCWQAFEDAGTTPEAAEALGPVGLWAGESPSAYSRHGLFALTERGIDVEYLQHLIGGDRDYLASAVSYRLGLTGPSMAIQTACSSSLVAVMAACDALRAGGCAMALAGGVTIRLPQAAGYLYQDGGIFSGDGRCRPFDSAATGTVFGSGVGVVLLKRLEDAIADGDAIHAVIRGGAVNNDGAVKAGFTAPSAEGQRRVIVSAMKAARVEPDSIGYVEAHGTATPIGDPIELEALTAAYGLPPGDRCAIGAAKSNIGHLEVAAGIAGLIKACCVVREGRIPPTLHFEQANTEIDFARTPFFVPAGVSPWPSTDGPRRAGISSFGIGGTNAHVVVEEPPVRVRRRAAVGPQTCVLSAPTETTLRASAGALALRLRTRPDLGLADICFTLNQGRRRFASRLAVQAESVNELAQALEAVAGCGRIQTYDEPAPVPDGRRVHLPPTMLDRARHWIEPAKAGYRRFDASAAVSENDTQPKDELAFDEIDSAAGRFMRRLAADHPWLADHRRDGVAVLPGAAAALLARAAAIRALDVSSVALVNVTWRRALSPVDGTLNVRVEVQRSGGNELTVRLFGLDGTVACEARALVSTPADAPMLDIAALAKRCATSFDSVRLGDDFARRGFAYGPAFRRFAELSVGDGECFARLTGAGLSLDRDAGALDAAMQAAFPLLDAGDAAWIPVGVGRCIVHRPDGRAALVHVRRTHTDRDAEFDAIIADADGQVLARLEGIRLRRAGQTTLMRSQWNDAPLQANTAAMPADGVLFVLDGVAETAEMVASHVPKQFSVIRVEPGIGFEQIGPAHFALDPAEPDDWRQLLAAVGNGAVYVLDRLGDAGGNGEPGIATAMLSRVLQNDHPGRSLRWLTVHDGAPGSAAVAALGRVIAHEQPAHRVAALQIDSTVVTHAEAIATELLAGSAHAVRLNGAGRQTPQWLPLTASAPNTRMADGLYLISGGLGALGLDLAEHVLAQAPGAHIGLLGRSRPSDITAERIAASNGALIPVPVDVTDADALKNAITELRARFGPVRGVIHAAGVNRDGLIGRTDGRDFAAVLAPKLRGAVHLDAVTRDDPLDWFALCSSLVGQVGNAGQGAYAYANASLDAFAERRAGPGRTTSILWPYLADGGLAAAPESIAQARRQFGLEPLSRGAALAAFDRAVGGDANVLVANGDGARLTAALSEQVAAPLADELAVAVDASLSAALIAHLRTVVANACGRSFDDTAVDTPFDEFGIDSLTILAMTERLEGDFGTMPKTLFYQFPTIGALTGHLLERFGAPVAAWCAKQPGVLVASTAPTMPQPPSLPIPRSLPSPVLSSRERDIAVVGLAARFPGADDLDGFWRNLAEGRDLIRDVPTERWGGDFAAHVAPGQKGGSYARWGSFLDGIDLFDPLFFRLSPREAALLDPQERLFLETAWHVFEDAAIDPSRIKGLPCGVFVGVMWGEYQLYGQATGSGAERPSASYASIANRVSHVMDFTGPSLAVDTMCSSSLVAIHLACEAIRSGDCTMAIAGGVNLAPHPNKWVLLSQGRFAATDGRCRAFGADGDGYVPGEGVGAVLLKPLSEALADGDRIWGVVRGSAVNHGGRTNAYTVPSPRAQAAVIRTALTRADVLPNSIGYVEAHGTGTSLGDPIEVAGLVEALGDAGGAGSVALGSVKSNIGHLESAAGIAGLAKVLLQMRERVIAPSLHSAPCNPNIDFSATPFVVPQTAIPWPQMGDAPLRAGISGFGAGGANAHLVVEAPPAVMDQAEASGPQVVLLSARTPHALTRLIARYAKAFDDTSLRLADIALTTQTGRAALEHRLAIVAGSMDDLRDVLAAAQAGRADARLIHGNTQTGGALRTVLGGDSGAVFIASLFASCDLPKLAQLWAGGHEVDWSALRSGGRRIALPLYPFERVRCWIDADVGEVRRSSSLPATPSQGEAEPIGHPALLVPGWRTAHSAEATFAGRIAVVGDGSWTKVADALRAELIAPEAADTLFERLDGFEAVIDAGLDAALERRHELWRALAARRGGPRLLTVRAEGAAGAFAGGIAAALGGEYGALWSREMQVDGISDIAPAVLASMLRAELGSDDGLARVLWRDGVRHRPVFDEAAPSPQPAIDLTAVGQSPVLITGGLGGLGMALARHLITRGVKVLALTGLRPLRTGDARSMAVEVLRTQGATVEVYTGDLQDDAFQTFVARLREQYGPVRGAVHAAGRVGDGARAYQSREFAQVRAVMQPKIDGLRALRRALGDDPLVFLVSYSSIAASIPSLAGGLVDYAAANAVLEAEAQATYAQGRRHERAIAWGNWTESGLGLAASDKLRPLGLAGLSDAEGVALFEQALTVDAPVVLTTGLRAGAMTDAWPLSRGASVTTRPATSRSVAPLVLTETPDRIAAMLTWLSGVFGRELKLPADELDAERRFEDHGIDSILLADLVLALERELHVKLEPGLLIEHRTLRQLAAHLATLYAAPGRADDAVRSVSMPEVPVRSQAGLPASAAPTTDRRIAVIGLSCDFPGAPDAKRFWANLSTGVDAITEVPADRWDIDRFYDPAGGANKSVSKWGGFIDGIALFDPAYFGIAPADAASLDPLVRKALEVAVQTLRDAGYADDDVKGSRTGVFVGARMSDYGARATTRRKRALTGSAQNFIAAQIAHCLDLHGPNLVVDTACSSSLTAVHLAVRSLIDGDSELALAGGVDLLLDETPYVGLTSGQALSPNGRCRTFDEQADGFVPGEGAGMVLLKRLDKALADGDRVLAVIEGSAVNNDGRTMGLTTPNPEAQESVIRQALAAARVDPRSVSYVEAHGTGTMIGDPIELKALWRALGDDGDRGRCAVGAVKSNIGHLLSAAGIASLIKVVLMLRHCTLAPTLHCATPNPRFAFDRSPLRPVTRAEPWQGVDGARRAGVSSFGFGGTNVHVVVSDHGVPVEAASRRALPPQVFNRQRYWIERRPRHDMRDDFDALAAAPARVLALYESIAETAE